MAGRGRGQDPQLGAARATGARVTAMQVNEASGEFERFEQPPVRLIRRLRLHARIARQVLLTLQSRISPSGLDAGLDLNPSVEDLDVLRLQPRPQRLDQIVVQLHPPLVAEIDAALRRLRLL